MHASLRGLIGLCLVCTAPITQAGGFLWRVEGGTAPVYLVGAVHVMPSKAYPLDGKFDRAYQESKVLVFETDMAAVDSPATQRQLINAGVYPEGESMQSRWSPQLVKQFTEAVQEVKLPVEMFSRSRPWLAALTLEMTTYQQAGFATDRGVDHFFFAKAKADRKSIVALESPQAQMRLFTDMPDAMSESFLSASIASLDSFDYEADNLYDLWDDEDIGELEDLLEETSEDHPGIYVRFVAQRNRQWLPTVVNLLKDGKPAMVVVGALHLPGTGGLIEGLEAAGYKVRRVSK